MILKINAGIDMNMVEAAEDQMITNDDFIRLAIESVKEGSILNGKN